MTSLHGMTSHRSCAGLTSTLPWHPRGRLVPGVFREAKSNGSSPILSCPCSADHPALLETVSSPVSSFSLTTPLSFLSSPSSTHCSTCKSWSFVGLHARLPVWYIYPLSGWPLPVHGFRSHLYVWQWLWFLPSVMSCRLTHHPTPIQHLHLDI